MRRLLPYFFLITTIAAGLLWWKAEQGRRAATDRLALLEAHQNLAPGATPPAAPPVDGAKPESPAPAPDHRAGRLPAGADPAQYLRTIDDLREHMREQAKELSAAKEATSRAEEALTAESAEFKKVKDSLDNLRDDLQAVRRLSDALQVELRAKSERLVKSETAEKLAQDRLVQAQAANVKVSAGVKTAEDLGRRREALLVSLLRRFREVNDLYRNFTLDAQTRETAGGGLQAGDLSRIQSAVQQAEEDLRQVQALNSRIAQLTK